MVSNIVRSSVRQQCEFAQVPRDASRYVHKGDLIGGVALALAFVSIEH